jgi:aminopeptidase N
MKRTLLLCLLCAPLLGQDPYNEKPSYARSRDFDLQHLKLELSFDLASRKLIGAATLRMAPISADVREAALDSAGLAIESVTVAGRQADFRTTDDKLYIALDRQYPGGVPVDFVVRYHAQPRRGLFFVLPDKYHPNRPKQIWANGDTAGGNNRYWFPTYDFPNDKTTTEMIVTVPSGWEALSNGELAGTSDDRRAGTRTYHWVQDKPMSTYLVSLVAGEFDKREEGWKVPVQYYVPRGRGGDIARTFGRTVEMLDFYSSRILPYPWAKYAQAMVDTFGGGMENTSATTEGASAILDARDFEDRRFGTDSLIAHEMVHQWFGDLVTCVDWRHAWLNEGFATYFEALWEEHVRGRDVFDWNELAAAGAITGRDRYPVVPPDGSELETAYSTIYGKGGWVLHMVRGQLGDALFWKAIQHYTRKYSYQLVNTSDFAQAVAESTGQDLEWLFDQYVYKPGHPEFVVSWDYDVGTRLLHLAVSQKQKLDGKPAPFHVPIEIEAMGDDAPRSFRIWAGKESADYYLGPLERPRTVLFDPRDLILKTVDFKKPAAEWTWQLAHATRALNREEAALALGSLAGPEVVAALEGAGKADPFFGVRIEAAGALGRIKSEDARAALLGMLGDADAQVRAAAARALGSQDRSPQAVERLLETARTDPSFAVRRSALASAARLKPEKGGELLKPFLAVDSPEQVIRAAAVAGLEQLGDESAVPALLDLSRSDDDRLRRAALMAFGTLGKGRQEVVDRLLEALQSLEKLDRQSAVFAFRQRKEESAIPALESLAASEALPGVARAARAAASSLRSPAANRP